jgi:hypothetical protein
MFAEPELVGRNVVVQVAVLTIALLVREQLEPREPVEEPERVKVTSPVGLVGLAFVSTTVAVHVDAWFATTGLSHDTEVVVLWSGEVDPNFHISPSMLMPSYPPKSSM